MKMPVRGRWPGPRPQIVIEVDPIAFARFSLEDVHIRSVLEIDRLSGVTFFIVSGQL